MTLSESPPRLRWRKTWDDHEDDFVAESPVPDVMIGRIMLQTGGPQDGMWFWTYQASIKGLPWQELDRSGFEPTPRQAATVIEEAWFRAIDGKTFDKAMRCFIPAASS